MATPKCFKFNNRIALAMALINDPLNDFIKAFKNTLK